MAGVGWLTLAAPRAAAGRRSWPSCWWPAFLLLNKVWSPQYSLWLLPLAVLARPRWRSLLLWQATEALLWVPRLLWYLGTDNRGVEVEWFFLGRRRPGRRRASCSWALVVRDVLHPDDGPRPDRAGPASTTRPAACSDGAA